MDELQKVELDIYIEFDRVCKELGLKYFADSGTLLGALRHKGFIPWDDDMDFVMLRNDYDTFCKKAQPLLPKHLFVQTYFTDKYYPLPFLKIIDTRTTYIQTKKTKYCQGIWIDIFPLDYSSSNQELLSKHRNRMMRFVRRLLIGTYSKANIYHILHNIILFIRYPSRKKTVQKLDFFIRNTPAADHSYVSNLWGLEKIPVGYFKEPKYCMFETLRMPIPLHSETILQMYYGDWKKLPPVSKRYSRHGGKIIYTNKSYKDI